MRIVIIGLLICFVLQAAEREESNLFSPAMQSTSAYIRGPSCKAICTVGFAMPFEKECSEGIQFRGVCHGSGKYGSELARITALFFQQELSHSASLVKDLCFMETVGVPGEFTTHMRTLFYKAQQHLLRNSSRDLENSCCQTALIYHNSYFNYVACLQVGKESMIAYEGKNDPLCITLHEGGLEKIAEPSICSFRTNLPRVVLVGAPQVVDFIFPHLAKCVEAYQRKNSTKAIRAGDVWEYVIKNQRFQGDSTNCGDFQLLAQKYTK